MRKNPKIRKANRQKLKIIRAAVSKELRKQLNDFDLDNSLLKARKLFLFDDIENDTVIDIIKAIHMLDARKKAQIYLYINSYGGEASAAISLIDAMKKAKSDIVTIITGEADSAAGLISICGDKRWITKYSTWMWHDMSGGYNEEEYHEKMKWRMKFLNEINSVYHDIIKEHTKLSNKEIDLAVRGELWINAEKAKELGIVDKII